uniref:Uncharacterized protein n=1 Tax=Romanomermis culicivorax TaxID=13658 RepID=A0A915L606_ROMCU
MEILLILLLSSSLMLCFMVQKESLQIKNIEQDLKGDDVKMDRIIVDNLAGRIVFV